LWFHATSPAFSSSILSALLQRLTTLGFIVVSPGPSPSTLAGDLRGIPDSRDVSLPFEAFPPPMAVVAGAPKSRCRHRTLVIPCGEAHTSCPAVTPLCCTTPVVRCRPPTVGLEARLSRHPARCRAGSWSRRPKRSRAPGVHQPPCHLVLGPSPTCVDLDPEPRGVPPSSGPLPGRRFQRTVPGAPVGLGSSVWPREPRR